MSRVAFAALACCSSQCLTRALSCSKASAPEPFAAGLAVAARPITKAAVPRIFAKFFTECSPFQKYEVDREKYLHHVSLAAPSLPIRSRAQTSALRIPPFRLATSRAAQCPRTNPFLHAKRAARSARPQSRYPRRSPSAWSELSVSNIQSPLPQ